jgi:hypothetical protein
MISFGLVNQEAQAKARIDSGSFTYYSNKNNLFTQRGGESLIYATLEENFTKVDGSMLFLPRRNVGDSYYDTGLIGEGLVSAARYELTINLHTAAMDFKGITIDFGENYPVDFDMVSSAGQVIEFRGNDQSVFSTEEVLENTTYVKLIFYEMKNPDTRLRVYSIRFGYGLVYYNDSVTASELNSYVSPIGADVPQIDFSVTLKNYDQYFNVDNPRSAINFLETGQEMDIYYGYELPDGTVEWIQGNHLLCSEWESDDYTATIRCQDIFRSMDAEYYRGKYNSAGVSYYTLAQDVLRDAGQTSYYIDPRLKRLYSKNPIPRVKHKEALQIIANACRCVLSQTRTGKIQIKSNFAPEASVTANAETSYSDVSNVLSNSAKSEYASLNTNYTTVDGTMYFLPRNGVGSLYTGFVSAGLSDANCEFATNPTVTIVQEAACMYYGVKLEFGNALPGSFTIRTYNNNELVEEYENEDEITKSMIILHEFADFDTMTIEFTSTAEPYNRIVLNHFAFGDITNFTMRRKDMLSSPKAIKQELIKEVIVPCYSYQSGTQEESLISEDVTVTAGETMTFFIGEPSYNLRATIDDSSTGVTIIESGSYFATVRFTNAGSYRFELLGYRYKIVERYAVNSLNARGKTVKWENPLISDMTMATDLADWLGDYYRSGIEYEYDNRGFPELDVNDIIYQENEFHPNMKVNVYRTTLIFNQAFEGKLTARRQED